MKNRVFFSLGLSWPKSPPQRVDEPPHEFPSRRRLIRAAQFRPSNLFEREEPERTAEGLHDDERIAEADSLQPRLRLQVFNQLSLTADTTFPKLLGHVQPARHVGVGPCHELVRNHGEEPIQEELTHIGQRLLHSPFADAM